MRRRGSRTIPRPMATPAAVPLTPKSPLRLSVSRQFGVWQTVLLPCSSFLAQLRLERLLRGCKFHARFFLPPELRQNPASQEVTALYVWLKLQGRINHFQSRLQLLLLLIELGQT